MVILDLNVQVLDRKLSTKLFTGQFKEGAFFLPDSDVETPLPHFLKSIDLCDLSLL